MSKDIKKCKQCGQFRNIEEFRVYYNRNKNKPPGRYRLCKTCEAINQRFKYLNTKQSKNTISPAEQQELGQIEAMYDLLREAGLEPPRRKVEVASNVPDLVLSITAAVSKQLEAKEEAGVELDTPDELVEWLHKDLQAYTPEELELVSDRLWSKYMPQVGLDDDYKPIKDETYRDVLSKIQDRFDAHEDEFYAQ